MDIRIVKDSITKAEIADIAKNQFGDLVKAVVDVRNEIIALGGELHADEEAQLLAGGSRQENLWGVNVYPEKSGEDWIEFDSMINVRPSQGNRSRGIEDINIQKRIREIIRKMIQ